MPDKNAIPASFEEAKALARQNMMAAQAQTEEDATQAVRAQTEDDETVDQTREPSASDEDDSEDTDEVATEDEDGEEDDDSDESEDDDAEEDDEDSTDDDDEPVVDQKRKPSRRSKKIEKLQDKIKRLEANSADSEERLLKRIQDEQARRAALETEQRQRAAEDQQIESEMAEYLGSDQEYRTAVRAALNGDPFEAEKAKTWDERREIFGKLNRRAEMRVNQKAAEIYWSSTEGLAGIDSKILEKADFGTVLRHLHEAGGKAAEAAAQAELAKRDAKIARLEAQLKTSAVKKAATSTKTPLEGGTTVKATPKKSIYEQSLNDDGSINRTKFDELRRRASMSSI